MSTAMLWTWSKEKMIGRSLRLCYPQVGASNLLSFRALWAGPPFDKLYPSGASLRFFKPCTSLDVGTVKVASARPTCQRATPGIGRA